VPARDPCTSSCSYPCLRLEALCRLVPQIGIIRTKDNALRHVALYIVVRALTAVAASHRDPADHMADPQVQYCRRPVRFWHEAKRTLHPIVGAAQSTGANLGDT